MWGDFVTCYISSGDEAEHHEDPQEHGANGGPDALSPPPAGTATSPRAPQHQPSFPVGPGCTLGCSRNFSPPPSTAHDTLPSETTIMAMLEQEVKLFDHFSLRKLPLQSSVIPKRCWKSAFQDRDLYCKVWLCLGLCKAAPVREEWTSLETQCSLFTKSTYTCTLVLSPWEMQTQVSKFLVARPGPSGSCVLRNLHLSSILGASSFSLPSCFCLFSQPLGTLTYFGSSLFILIFLHLLFA